MPDDPDLSSYATHISLEPQDKRILVEITSDYPHIFKNVQKFAGYINHLMGVQTQSLFFVEIIQNGVIYIYHDFEIFSVLNPVIRKKEIQKMVQENFTNAEFFLQNVLDSSTFPLMGVQFKYKVFAIDVEPPLQILINFFHSFQNPEIAVKRVDNSTVTAMFATYRGLQMYANHLGTMLYQMIPDSS